MDMVSARFTAIYSPKSSLSVDKTMIPFKGKFHKVYSPTYYVSTSFISRSICNEAVPSKKTWFKVWVIADSKNSYFLDVDIYVGRPSDGDNTERGLGERVVLQLTEQFRNKNYRVFCDNFFSSPALFSELLAHNLYACGTVGCDRREFPLALKGLNLQRGEHQFRQRGSLSAIVWQDKPQVSALSTFTDPEVCVPVRRKEQDGTYSNLTCPQAITTYNKYMRGVD